MTIRWIDALKQRLLFKLATLYLRYLTGFAFVFASIVKIRGERFTRIPASEPIGYFFEAMYQTGAYWQFLGWAQFMAGALLMTQRFASLGALLFLPVIANVFMITHAIDFGSGTPVITTLMLLSTLYLIVWDYQKWFVFVQRDHHIRLDMTHTRDALMDDPLWTWTGVVFVALTVFGQSTGDATGWWLLVMLMVGIVALVWGLMRARSRRLAHQP